MYLSRILQGARWIKQCDFHSLSYFGNNESCFFKEVNTHKTRRRRDFDSLFCLVISLVTGTVGHTSSSTWLDSLLCLILTSGSLVGALFIQTAFLTETRNAHAHRLRVSWLQTCQCVTGAFQKQNRRFYTRSCEVSVDIHSTMTQLV